MKFSGPPKWEALLQVLEEIKTKCKLDRINAEKGTLLFLHFVAKTVFTLKSMELIFLKVFTLHYFLQNKYLLREMHFKAL